jgi:hypothetical protein
MRLSTEPPISPVWSSTAWRGDALTWVDRSLAARGARRTGDAEQVRVRPWSTQLRVPTDHGTAWMKACGPVGTDEAALYDVLVAHAADVVVPPWATDAEQGRLLLPDAGTELRRVATRESLVDQWAEVLRRYGHLQRQSAGWAAELEAAGLLRLTPGELVEEWRKRTGARDPVDAAQPALQQAADRLASGPVPLALQHDDLHAGNVFCADSSRVAARRARFFDWGDAYVGHPFMTLLISLRGPSYHFDIDLTDDERWHMVDAYLEAWTDLAGLTELRPLVEQAVLLARIGRALGWERALARATDAEWAEWGEGPQHWLDDVTRLATSAGPVW